MSNDTLGSRQDNELHSYKLVTDAGETKVAQRVDDPVGNILLDGILNALGGASYVTPTIFNVSCASNATEYSQALPANTKCFILKARNASKINFSYSLGTTLTNYISVPSGAVFEDKNLYSSQTIYFTCSKNSEVVEIVAYT